MTILVQSRPVATQNMKQANRTKITTKHRKKLKLYEKAHIYESINLWQSHTHKYINCMSIYSSKKTSETRNNLKCPKIRALTLNHGTIRKWNIIEPF